MPRSGPRAPDKLVFLLSLVPYLIELETVEVSAAAKHFRMEPEQIREAVRLIATSGLPGETGTYQPNDLFDIDWDAFEEDDLIVIVNQVAIDDAPRLSAREAAALIAGLQYLSALPENTGSTQLTSLLNKLTLGASAAPSSIAVAANGKDSTLEIVREALASGRQIEFDYRNALGKEGRRRADPLRIISQDADWYLQGYSYSREAVRNFRIDRMQNVVMTNEPLGNHFEGELSNSLFQASDSDLDVVVDVVPTAVTLISDYLADASIENVATDRARVRLRVAHYHGLKRLVCGLPGLITVVSPPEARAVVADWARGALDES